MARTQPDDVNWKKWQCMNSVIDTLPALFIAIASIINCVQWLNYYLKMKLLDGQTLDNVQEKIILLQKYRKRINFCAAFLVLLIASVLMYYYFKGCLIPVQEN